jgi:hypothetical protein
MILLEGPNRALRTQLGPAIRAAMPAENPSLHVSGDNFRPKLQRLVHLVHADHRWQIRDGLPLDHLEPDARHMIAYGLYAAGTMVVICAEDGSLTMAQAEDLAPSRRVLPLYSVHPGDDLAKEAQHIALYWRMAVQEASRFWHYGSNGPTQRSPIMLVGDRANPFVPAELNQRRMAFVSHHGCSLYLHGAMRRAGGRYYVTNAVKANKKTWNLLALREEIEKVRPSRIVALGTEAAEVLAKVDARFTTTYHPQYWRRFQASRLGELVDCLQP